MPLDNAGPFLTDPNGHEHRLSVQTATIGRAVECDIVIASKSVSREHTRVRRDGRRWFVDDLGSTNGTYLNGERVIGSLAMLDGDSLISFQDIARAQVGRGRHQRNQVRGGQEIAREDDLLVQTPVGAGDAEGKGL